MFQRAVFVAWMVFELVVLLWCVWKCVVLRSAFRGLAVHAVFASFIA
jgi:hypothetical protein